jgi:hypothetical protein
MRLLGQIAHTWTNADNRALVFVRLISLPLFPPRDKSRQPSPVSKVWVKRRLQDIQWVSQARARLQRLNWFMKCSKEPLARMVNRQDQPRGAFFEEHFESVGILDDESLPERLGSNAERWWSRIETLSKGPAAGPLVRGKSRTSARSSTRPARSSPGKPRRMPGE